MVGGFQQWLIQRVSAVVLSAYTVFIIFFLVTHPNLSFSEWKLLFDCELTQYVTVISLLALIAHTWIGMWTVATDYIKISWFRWLFLIALAAALLLYFLWGINVVYS